MSLPLLERARSGDAGFLYTPVIGKRTRGADALVQIHGTPLIPQVPLQPGQQYRFHFDMTKCVGCKCCVVACNEQNGNPAALNWRRVGEIEGGHFPYTQRYYLSMGCNHCLEPSCLEGCPVEAYTKDTLTGIVDHSADTCIGCQYCTWNCSYGVPQYNPERGVVGKCDMCHHRLTDGMAPACVAACPQGAIAIEIVETAGWRQNYLDADVPGLPSADDSISTTRITRPVDLLPDTGRVDTQRIGLEEPHWPLVFMLVLTQLSVGAFVALWILDLAGTASSLLLSAMAALGVAGVSLGASTLHLGRPVYAWRALRGWKRSWLSREVLGLSAFAGAASLFAGLLLLDLPGRAGAGLLTALCGVLGVWCSARIYMVRARPAWNTSYTPAEFFATAFLLGPLFVRALGAGDVRMLGYAAAAGAAVQLVTQALKFLWLARAEQFEPRASGLLLSTRLRRWYLLRMALLVAAGFVLSLQVHSPAGAAATLLLALAGEWMGRWLFFVSVVPKNIAASFTGAGKVAA
ncbi:MAG: DmsC/YnfH family molybdoenzyme membrane anchor subunit [Bryobacteraceae bacterium]|nr:DmsC/YnfH family molybdoenzyme membrane anchor subunit [Bryobacteraceae bacterium]